MHDGAGKQLDMLLWGGMLRIREMVPMIRRTSLKVGVGISTYGRRDVFHECIGNVNEYTRDDTVVVISDDGSPEGPPDAAGNILLSNANGGIARNKNRLLANLFDVQCVDVAILLEDDVRPTVHNWEDPWALVGLINGAGFWAVPGLPTLHSHTHIKTTAEQCSAQCLVVSREAFNKVGYFDPRFTGYGFEHAEWQHRLAREGFGGVECRDGIFYMAYDFQNLQNVPSESNGSQEKIDEMWPIFAACHNDTGWKNAWIDEEDRLKFYAEAGIDLPVNA